MRNVVAVCLLLALPVSAAVAQTGKIAGTVVEAATGMSLPGVNVVLEGTTQGAVTNAEGYYVILNVRPGTYDVRASFIGFTPQVQQGVDVNIDLTSEVDFALTEEAVGLEEVVVTARQPVVRADVSASMANVSSSEIESLPVASINEVVGLQAGIQGLSVRGGGADELSFMVNGLTMRDERDNTPFTGISLVAVDEVQVQTGGFNAEYGNVRSGIINVVTKEGRRDRYNVDVVLRYSPPTQKHFGPPANDPDSYWIRPYVDPEVAYVGTQGWDPALQAQYPEFEGWISVAQKLLSDQDPDNDMTPEGLRQAFLFQHRKEMEIVEPDYTIDAGVGGPVPLLNRFGDTRFYFSYQRDQDMYLIPLSRDRYQEHSGHLKVTTDVAPAMKLTLEGLLGEVTGTAASRVGNPGLFRSASGIAGAMDRVSFIDTRLFAEDYWTPSKTQNSMFGAKLSHALSDRTFYEVRLARFGSVYDTNPGDLRDTTDVVYFSGVGFDEAPFGFMPDPSFGVGGMRMGVGMSNARDSSEVTVYNAKADLTSQVNRYLQVKTGLEYNLTDSRVNYGSYDKFLRSSNQQSTWERKPVRGAAYAQSKLEFQGMIANLGVRLDYFNAGGEWYDLDDPFTKAFSARFVTGIDTLLSQEPTDHLFTVSPRLGISFPVTEYSKLYFNYGHFRSMPDPNSLFLFRQYSETGQVARVADPNLPLPRTVAYELGYEHALFDQYLVRVAGFYRDVSLQPRTVDFVSRDGQTNYSVYRPNSYEDIRGFEATLARNRGRWVRGFVNYTYRVDQRGYFGFDEEFENPTQQREVENSDAARRAALSRPVPRPFGRLNLDLFVPDDFGPAVMGVSPLGGWRVSFIGHWQDGFPFTWTGGGEKPGVRNNVQLPDYTNVELRLAKNFAIGGRSVQFFVDVNNLFDQQRMSLNGFSDGNDYIDYMMSLHLPASDDYPNIPGDDQPGDYRPLDVPYQPIAFFIDREGFRGDPVPGTIYYEKDTGGFLVFEGGDWQPVEQDRLDQVLDDRAYIDNPDMPFLSFLNPRDVYFGIKLSF